MHLSVITISNLRIFQNLELELNPGLNILVGENDSGKTTLIDAVRYTLGTNSSGRIFINENDFYGEENELKVQLKFADVDDHAHRFVEHLTHEEYEDDEGNKKRRSVLYVQLTAQKTGTERRGYPYIKSEVRSGIDGNGLLLETEVRDFLAATYLRPLRDAQAEMSSGRGSRLSQILSSSKDIGEEVDAILDIVAKANDELLQDDTALRKSAKKIQEQYLHQLIFEVDKKRLGAFIDIAGIRPDQIGSLAEYSKRRYLRAILEGLNLALTEDNRIHGLGYHNLLFMAAELLLLEQEADNEFPLLLIEEPEAHLHPQLQMKLLKFINSKAQTSEGPEGVQCLLTTHSPNISSKADPSLMIMLSEGRSWSLRPGETELETGDYKYLRKFLDATKANVFFAKGLIFVEGDAENILLPEIARLLGRPFENYGVSVIKYDNSGSWKRFAKLFLRPHAIDNPQDWYPAKVCVLRDLDLWPDCAEDTPENPYGFKSRIARNASYWLSECGDVERRKRDLAGGLERQNVKISISNDWTFEYCLAKHGLFEECCNAIRMSKPQFDNPEGDMETRATAVLSNVEKTDFAYDLARLLAEQRESEISAAFARLGEEERNDSVAVQNANARAKGKFALELKGRLPPYIVEAIEYVTDPIGNDGGNGEGQVHGEWS